MMSTMAMAVAAATILPVAVVPRPGLRAGCGLMLVEVAGTVDPKGFGIVEVETKVGGDDAGELVVIKDGICDGCRVLVEMGIMIICGRVSMYVDGCIAVDVKQILESKF
jgi:hypothetical protein